MPRSVRLLALVFLVSSAARAQGRASSDVPLHLPVNHFEFVVSGDSQPSAKPLVVHNGGTAKFTDVKLARLTFGDSSRGAGWLVSVSRQSTVAPDELATVGSHCVDAKGLAAGTYRATAAVGAKEIAEPVAITITLVVTEAGARARHSGCSTAISK
jgi:hypothetical protein